MISEEVKLWRGVITQAIKDATIKSTSPEDQLKARRWLSHGGIDFEIVCELADINPDALKEFWKKTKKVIN